MKTHTKGSSRAALIILVALIVVGAGIYVYLKNASSSSAPVADQNQELMASSSVSQDNVSATLNTYVNTTRPTDSTVSVPGMSKYTDATFGFTFWYPSTWIVQPDSSTKAQLSIAGATRIKTIAVGPQSSKSDSNTFLIQEYTSPSMSITDSTSPGPVGGSDTPSSVTYKFDTRLHSWVKQSQMPDRTITSTALTSFTNTMGGLHMLPGTARFGNDTIIPLSATHFLVVSNAIPGDMPQTYLARTVTATDPSVATPVDFQDQNDTILKEGLLYGTLGTRLDVWYIYNGNLYDTQGDIIPGANVSAFRLIKTFSDGYTTEGTGYATDDVRIYSGYSTENPILQGADPATFVPIRQAYQIPYAPSSGKYGQSFTSYDVQFAKDKSHVWYSSKLIPGADPATFVVTGNTYVKNSNGIYEIAHDAHHTYGIDERYHLAIDNVPVQQ